MHIITVILQYALSIFALSLIVMIHELGHFSMARLSGVHVEEFFIGFGPKLLKFKDKKGTVFGISAIPLGGYNKLLGMNRNEAVLSGMENKAFYNKPAYKKLLILIGGPGFSVIFAVILISVFLSFAAPTTTIAYIQPDAPADTGCFEVGDKVVSLEGQSVKSWDDFSRLTKKYPGEEVTYKVIRQGETIELKVKLDIVEGEGYLGISPRGYFSPGYAIKEFGFFGLIKESFRMTWEITVNYIKLFGMLFTGRLPLSQARPVSPVGVVSMFQQSVSIGIQDFIFFVALVSMIMGYGNLIPILPLDGGNIAIIIIESIIRRPVPVKVLEVINSIGVFILVSLLIVAFVMDIVNPFDIINL
jgi:regulator of sigma E protease